MYRLRDKNDRTLERADDQLPVKIYQNRLLAYPKNKLKIIRKDLRESSSE